MTHVKFGMGINSLGVSCEVTVGYFKAMPNLSMVCPYFLNQMVNFFFLLIFEFHKWGILRGIPRQRTQTFCQKIILLAHSFSFQNMTHYSAVLW